jgi:hypothetical protein
MHLFPQRGSVGPWAGDQNYTLDCSVLSQVDDPALKFTESVVNTGVRSAEVTTV